MSVGRFARCSFGTIVEMFYELRRYRIEPGRLEAFATEWKAQVAPLRRAFGFTVVAGWVVPERDEFIWILGHDDEPNYIENNRRYYDSEERHSIDPDPARFVVEMFEHPATQVI